MHPPESSCEIASRPAAGVPAGSRVVHLGPDFRWPGAAVAEYKQSGEHHCGVTRVPLVGDQGEATAFHVRYFEIAPAGFSSMEHHGHEHAVVVLRGRGQVQLGAALHDLTFGDTVYIAANEVHQFRNPFAEPFGFLCVVDAQRDRPVLVTG
jgi:quercetin dioxygenase-like cupin family protein